MVLDSQFGKYTFRDVALGAIRIGGGIPETPFESEHLSLFLSLILYTILPKIPY